MKKYNKVYFLHIPKTGGRFFSKYILNPIAETLAKNEIEIVKLPTNVDKHGGWHKDIDESTYIICIFRDPVEFFVSAVTHMAAGEQGLIDEKSDFIVKEKSKKAQVSKEYLFNSLEELKYMKNFQSQNFFLSPQSRHIVSESRHFYNEKQDLDFDLIHKRVSRINLMIRTNDLKTLNYDLLIQKISQDLEIDVDIDSSSIDRDYYKNDASQNLLSKLDNNEIKKIRNNFLFDQKIYNNDLLFWTNFK